jgi:ribosomal protein S18 acetylase RimI-like enzyme
MNPDHLITSIYKWDELDLDELAQFSFEVRQSRPETFNIRSSVEEERRMINWRQQFSPSFVVITKKGNKILGWLSFDLDSTTILEIGRWLPLISPTPYEDQVIASLLEECKNYCIQMGYPRIEVSCSIRDEEEKRAYEIYKKWYETNDFPIKDEISYMTRNLSESDNTEIIIPQTFETKSILEIDDKELYKCYYKAFLKTPDRTFQDQTEDERLEYFHNYFSKSKPLIKEASLVLKKTKSHQILGVTLVRPRGEDAHLALLAIHPSYQGRKLGGLLIRLILKTVFQQGFKTISLGVDVKNPSIRIYGKFGFETKSHIITHSWKVNQLHEEIYSANYRTKI